MQQQDHGAIGRPGFCVADIQEAGIDLLQRGEGRVRPGLDWLDLGGLGLRGADQAQLGGGDGHGGDAEQPATLVIDLFGHSAALSNGNRGRPPGGPDALRPD